MDHHRADSSFTTRQDLDARLDQHRRLILSSLDGLSEQQARATPVAGRTST